MAQVAVLQAQWILPLAAEGADLPRAGGKGANLSRMARAGFAVPDGFLISTAAYQAFVAANRLSEAIAAALAAGDGTGPETFEEASRVIRTRFGEGQMPPGMAGALLAAYAALGRPEVAVRSSATAEDLPDMSFAGQQDTYLNVVNDEALLRAVVDCWSSLWTARAISYRARNGVPQDSVALAVVVETMVQSEASGVLFTANPVTGLRRETVIDATLGLGEALVGGLVEPDHYVVDTVTRQITARTLGRKALSVRSRPDGGTATVALEASEAGCQALPDEQILELTGLGQRVAELYGSPQDVEWGWAGGRLYLLQARPITSLYPVPEVMPPEPLKVMFSFGAVQGMLDPLTPLCRDYMREVFAAGSRVVGIRVTRETQTVLHTAGERLWGNITSPLRNTVGRKIVRAAIGYVEPGTRDALASIWDEHALQPTRKGVSRHAARHLAHLIVPVAAKMLLNLLAPDRRRRLTVENGERLLETMRIRLSHVHGGARARVAQLARLLPDWTQAYLPGAFRLFVAGVASGMASFNLLKVLARHLSGGPDAWDERVLEVTRGMPHNPTTEMDLALWQTAQDIRGDAASRQAFEEQQGTVLTARYLTGKLPTVAQQSLARFMARYGGRGLAEIDLGRPRWSEEPGHVIDVVSGYLQITDAAAAPDAVFARGAASARALVDRMSAEARSQRRGWLKARLIRFAASRTRALMPMRESPKFFVVRLFALVREELLKAGRELVAAGELDQADDLFYLTFSELAAFGDGRPADWSGLIAGRRADYEREGRRRQIPRLLLSDGRAFYGGAGAASATDGTLAGSPVSPGVAEGRVRVVLDPRHAGLQPGEVLVCPGTDPSWTPLFLIASALVMEVGGMMTHGAVVAREYGIPAVVGLHEATTRLHTGQRIRVSGSDGTVILLDMTSEQAAETGL